MEGPPKVKAVEGEGILTLLLSGLQKYTVYVLQVLAYTQLGDGPPSNPILRQTREDGKNYWPLFSHDFYHHLRLCCSTVCCQRLVYVYIYFFYV